MIIWKRRPFSSFYSGEIRIKSLLISVDKVVHTTKDKREGDRERLAGDGRPGSRRQVTENCAWMSNDHDSRSILTCYSRLMLNTLTCYSRLMLNTLTCYSRLMLNTLMQIRTIRTLDIDGLNLLEQDLLYGPLLLVLRAHNLGDYHEP